MNNYRFRVVTIFHAISLYPVELTDVPTGAVSEARDEATFVAVLKRVLTSDKIRLVLESLLAQSKATTAE
jgi:hypothetical protein